MMQQHGDVLILAIRELPSGATRIKPCNGNYVLLAEGEATGHAHTVVACSEVALYTLGDSLYLKVEGDSPVSLVHQEHATQEVQPGVYEIGRVVEVDPFEDEVRQVAD